MLMLIEVSKPLILETHRVLSRTSVFYDLYFFFSFRQKVIKLRTYGTVLYYCTVFSTWYILFGPFFLSIPVPEIDVVLVVRYPAFGSKKSVCCLMIHFCFSRKRWTFFGIFHPRFAINENMPKERRRKKKLAAKATTNTCHPSTTKSKADMKKEP